MTTANRFVQACGLWKVQRCAVTGCGALTTSQEKYCAECIEAIEALREWHALHDGRESRAAMALFQACHAVRRRLWIPMLGLFVYVACVMALDVAAAFQGWIAEGGLSR